MSIHAAAKRLTAPDIAELMAIILRIGSKLCALQCITQARVNPGEAVGIVRG